MTRTDKVTFYCLVCIGLLLTGLFAVMWFWPGNIPHNFTGIAHLLDFLLFTAVSYVVWHQIGMEVLAWMIAEKIKQPQHIPPAPSLKVAFITTFVPGSEPIELLHRILPALKAAEYPHDTWLLDEGRSKEARFLCQQYGVQYFSRQGLDHYNTPGGKFAARTKGGNHNAWYDAYGHTYDVVAQIDTDFIPHKDFLTKTLGYFNDPTVAFVGTPQIYGNEHKSFVAKGAAEQQYTFYGPVLRGLYGRDTMMLLGANHVIRVAALKDINYYGGHLTEDLLTGMTLHGKGWKSVYVPEALAEGEGPETWTAYFNQQMRWAFGCMDILFHHSPKLLKNMTWERRRYYFMLLQHYFNGLAMAIGVATVVLSLVLGISAASMSSRVLLVYAVLVVWQLFVSTWLQRYNVRPERERGLLLAGKILSIAAWPIYFLALVGVLRGKRISFKVTPKGDNQDYSVPLLVFLPHIVIGLATATALILSFVTHDQNPIILFWAMLTLLTMLGVAFGAWINGFLRTWKTQRRVMLQRVDGK